MNLPKEAATDECAYLTALRRELHRHPELALEEEQTAQVIERDLDNIASALPIVAWPYACCALHWLERP